MLTETMEITDLETSKETKSYTYDEVFVNTLEYFRGDELAARVWISKYAMKDSAGNIYEKSPEQMHQRIANEIVRMEQKYPNPMSYNEVIELLHNFRYIIPQGSPMAGIGNNYQVASLSNCFVIGNEKQADSYGGIMKVDQEQVQLMKRRGGVGHDLSHIRPSGSPVMNSALTSTGIVPFMERYSNSTREVAQDGRRGALMLTLSIKHPDAENFIDAKLTQGKITGANISVKIDDEFMNSVVSGKPYTQHYPVDSKNPTFKKDIDSSKLWNKIIHNAWKSAEPGVMFWDTIIRESVPDCYAEKGFRTISTNPCGEIPLCNRDSCRLLAINLYSYVNEPFTPRAHFNFELFTKHVHAAQRIMDDIIDLELEKIEAILSKIEADPEHDEVKRVERKLWEEIRIKATQGRRTGIGTTGEGDMLAALGLRYGSENAIDFSVEVHKTLALEAYRSSVMVAKERGAFPIFDAKLEKNNPFIQRLKEADNELYCEMVKHGRRNIALLTIAPTGTTSLMCQTTSGIEPVFMPFYKRRRKVNPNDKEVNISFVDEVGDAWEEFNVFHHKFLKWLKVNNFDIEAVKHYDDKKLEELVLKSPYYKATSRDVDWLSKVKMQGAIQKWVDHSISVTVNLPEDATEALVGELYVTAWRSGCKGVTVYREGSRAGVLIAKTTENKEAKETKEPKRRPYSLETEVIRFQNNKEKWIAFLGLKDGKPYEIFTGMDEADYLPIPSWVKRGIILKQRFEDGTKRYDFQYVNKAGLHVTIEGLSYKFNPIYWNYAKLLSGVLRQGMAIASVVTLISSLHFDSDTINSWKNGVERALRKYIPNGTHLKTGNKCDNCGAESLVYEEGCIICKSCGSSRCG